MPNPIHNPRYDLFRAMLTKARIDQGMLQADLAALIGKPQSYISKYERGERRIDLPEFVELAKALGIDIHKFISDYIKAIG